MQLSLRNLFRGLHGRRASGRSPRPIRPAKLQVECLEARDAPSAQLLDYRFNFGNGGSLVVLSQSHDQFVQQSFNGPWIDVGASFQGTYSDQHGSVPVSGWLKPLGGGLDSVTFQGSAVHDLTFMNQQIPWSRESVSFQGTVTEPANNHLPAQMWGSLYENGGLLWVLGQNWQSYDYTGGAGHYDIMGG